MKSCLITLLSSILFYLSLPLVVLLLLFLVMGPTDKYAENSGWSCSNEEFVDVYCEEYMTLIDTLKQKYNIVCEEERREIRNRDGELEGYSITLYNDVFSIWIVFSSLTSYGNYHATLYYFGNDEAPFSDYESQRRYVEFINELTHSVAYDTKQEECANHFEKMFFDNLQIVDGKPVSSYYYHFDDLVGYVGYHVNNDTYVSVYYKIQGNPDIDYPCSKFEFEGILKPIENGD